MEKVWAERAGLGWIGKNGCLINPRLGSWLTLSVMFVDRAVDAYDAPAERALRRLHALPAAPVRRARSRRPAWSTRAAASPTRASRTRTWCRRRLRAGFDGRIFGCDVCQEVCPWNHRHQPEGDSRFAPRPLSALAPAEVAALAPEEFDRLAAGMAVARARYHGMRRNALYAIGSAA